MSHKGAVDGLSGILPDVFFVLFAGRSAPDIISSINSGITKTSSGETGRISSNQRNFGK